MSKKDPDEKKPLGKPDIFLLAGVVFLCCIFMAGVFFLYAKQGDQVRIQVNGKEYGTYALDQDQTIPVRIHGKITNVVCIKNGYAYMKEADCPDHLCMKQGKINENGQTIVCLPRKVVVTVIAQKKAAYDSISK